MWDWLINRIPDTQLDAFAWRFGLLAILMSILGGLLGWVALDIRNRSSALKAVIDQQRGIRLKVAEDELTKAQDEVASLKKFQEPWTLSETQRQTLAIRLRNAGKGRVVIEYIRSDERRSRPFAEQITGLLRESGFDVWGYMAAFMQAGSPPLVGMQLSVKNRESEDVAIGLQQALKTIGLDAPVRRRHPQDTTYDDDQVVIDVGMKP